MKNQDNLFLITGLYFGAILILISFLVWFYENKITKWEKVASELLRSAEHSIEKWKVCVDEIVSRGNKILQLINSLNIVKNQNVKYSKICRKLYNDNKELITFLKIRGEKIENLILQNQSLESLFIDMKNKANEFELKIAELEKNKLKKRDRKKI